MGNEEKRCPYCGEIIKSAAKKCKFCGEWLEQRKTEYKPPLWHIIGAVFLILCVIGYFLPEDDISIVNDSQNTSSNSSYHSNILDIFRSPESKLISGCSTDGTKMEIDSSGGGEDTMYYCKNKPWQAVGIYKGYFSNHKQYNIYVTGHNGVGYRKVAATFWKEGGYVCKYGGMMCYSMNYDKSFVQCNGLDDEFIKNATKVVNYVKNNEAHYTRYWEELTPADFGIN